MSRERNSQQGTQNQSHSNNSKRTTRRRKKRSAGASAAFALMYVVAIIATSILLACIGWVAANDVLALNKPEKTISITITKDDSFSDVASRLKKDGMIEYKALFNLFASVTHSKGKISAGTYTLTTDMDYRALIAGMGVNSATKAEVSVTIPEGYSVAQIFALLEDQGVSTVEELTEIAATHDYAFSFLQGIPLGDAARLEGFLYPDTYTFNTPHSALWAINKMLVTFDERVDDSIREQIQQSGYSMREILTIASLVERETDASDRAKIASVIYNRLNNPSAGTAGYLQIDATLAYINGGKVPTEADKAIASPYNTYMYKGLPPAPIANPGLASIKAAITPEKTGYYYYALGDDGVHHFFKTYNEHQSFIASQQLYKN